MVATDVYQADLNTAACIRRAVASFPRNISKQGKLNTMAALGLIPTSGNLNSPNDTCLSSNSTHLQAIDNTTPRFCSNPTDLHTADITPNLMVHRTHGQPDNTRRVGKPVAADIWLQSCRNIHADNFVLAKTNKRLYVKTVYCLVLLHPRLTNHKWRPTSADTNHAQRNHNNGK